MLGYFRTLHVRTLHVTNVRTLHVRTLHVGLYDTPSSSFHLGSNDSPASAGCLSRILHRNICGNLHNAASRVAEEAPTDLGCVEKKPPTAMLPPPPPPPPSPGLVARLMGLESMPELPCNALPDTIWRTQSAIWSESRNRFLSGHSMWVTKNSTSQSFREVPTFLREENKDFLLLSFCPDDNAEAFSSNRTGPSKKNALERKNNETKENVAPPKDCHRKSPKGVTVHSSKKPATSMCTKKSSTGAPLKVELEYSPKNSSPLSVLDQPIDLDSSFSGN